MVTARHPLLSLVLAVSLALPVAACAAPSSSHPVPDVGNAVSPVPGVVSSGRLDASDVATLQANGFRQVIDLTPDDETPGFDEAGLVREAGMAYANLPIRGPADLTRANVAAFDARCGTSTPPYWCTAPAATASAPWLRCGQPG